MIRGFLSICFCAIGLSAIVYCGWRTYSRVRANNYAKSHLINFTRGELKNIAAAIKVYCEIDRKRLRFTPDRTLSGRDLYDMLVASENASELLRPNDRTVQEKVLLDEWGQEVHWKFETQGDHQHILLWSDGPNHKNDNCQGDDIVIEFNVAILDR